jgi:hypothetical protein
MNVTNSRSRTGRGIRNDQSMRGGFGIRPTSFHSSKSVRQLTMRQTQPRRVSMDQNEYLMVKYKSTQIIAANEKVVFGQKFDPQPIKRLNSDVRQRAFDDIHTDHCILDDYTINKPVRKQNRTETSIEACENNETSSLYDVDEDDKENVHAVDALPISETEDNTSFVITKQKRKVRFQLDELGNIQCRVHYMTEEETELIGQCQKKDLWLRKQDRMASLEAATSKLFLFAPQFPAYQLAILQLLTKFGGLDDMSQVEALNLLSRCESHQPRSDFHAIQTIARCSDTSRGLEKRLFVIAGIPRIAYRDSVKRLLATQSEFKQSGYFTNDALAHALATQYRTDTTGALAMARLFAKSDTIAMTHDDRTLFDI